MSTELFLQFVLFLVLSNVVEHFDDYHGKSCSVILRA